MKLQARLSDNLLWYHSSILCLPHFRLYYVRPSLAFTAVHYFIEEREEKGTKSSNTRLRRNILMSDLPTLHHDVSIDIREREGGR